MEHRLSFGMWGPLSGAQGFLPQAQQLLCLQILRREAAEPHQPNPELCAAERPTLRAQNGSCVTCSALGTRHEAFRRRLPVLGPQGLVNTGSAHRGPEQPSTSRECREVLFAFQRFWQNQVSLPVTLITHTRAVFPSPPGTPSCSLRPAVKDQTPNHSLGHESFVSSSASEGSQRQLVSRQALTLHFCSESFPTKCTACSWCRESGLRKDLGLVGNRSSQPGWVRGPGGLSQPECGAESKCQKHTEGGGLGRSADVPGTGPTHVLGGLGWAGGAPTSPEVPPARRPGFRNCWPQLHMSQFLPRKTCISRSGTRRPTQVC